MRTEVICLWGLAIPLALVMAFIVKAPVPIVFFFMKIDEIVKAILCLIRMKGDKWLNSLTREGAA